MGLGRWKACFVPCLPCFESLFDVLRTLVRCPLNACTMLFERLFDVRRALVQSPAYGLSAMLVIRGRVIL